MMYHPTTTATAGSLVTSQVSIKDISLLMPISRSLAESAGVVDHGDPVALCAANEAAAARSGRYDLVRVWRTAALLVAGQVNGAGVEWGRIPLGRSMLRSMYERKGREEKEGREVEEIVIVIVC